MVVYKSDIKRRYRDTSNCVESLPKRAKVHAQRKFAQGLNASSVIPEKTFVKEKEKTKPNGNSEPVPLLPADRPKTEDFLTFLCFRGTSALPQRLDFFNVASASDNSYAVASTSNQSSSEVLKAKKEKLRGKHSAVKIHPNKFKAKARKARAASSMIDLKRRTNGQTRNQVLRRQQVAVRRTPRSITRRPINSAIHRRINDKRLRAGLRSGGVLPAGSDVGLSVFRRPRSSSSSQTVTYPVRKSAIPLGDSSEEDVEGEEEDDYDEDIEEEVKGKGEKEKVKESSIEKKIVKEEKRLRSKTRSSSLRSHCSPVRSVKQMPTRKTKEAAAAYMEMLSKSMRSPDVDSDSYDEAEDPAKLEKESKRTRNLPVRETNLSKKVIPKKGLPGRSLKDKSLKRAPLISQRKIIGKSLRIKRGEEISKRRTRSKTEAISPVKKSSRPQRSLGNQSKIDLKDELNDEEEKEEMEEEENREEKQDMASKRNDLKRDAQKKLQIQPPVTERRSKRFAKDEEVENVEVKTSNKAKAKKKQTKKSSVPSPVESPQETRSSRRSKGSFENNKRTESIKALEVKSSPSRTRNQDNRKEVRTEVELQSEVKNSPAKLALRKNVSKKDVKAEKKDELTANTRRPVVKKEIKVEGEKYAKASPSRLRSYTETVKKETIDDNKSEPESKVTPGTNERQVKSSIKKDPVVEPDIAEVKNSPARTLRKTSSLDIVPTQEESSKSASKNKANNDDNSNKKGQEIKGKTSSAKEDEGIKEDESDKNTAYEESVRKSKRNSRASPAVVVKEPVQSKRKVHEKKPDPTNSPAIVEDKRPKRSIGKKIEVKVISDEPVNKTVEEEGKVKKQTMKKPSKVKAKSNAELNFEEDKIKTVAQARMDLEKIDVLDGKPNQVKEEVPLKPKLGVRKKGSVVSLSDEEFLPKEAPKKKFKQCQSEEPPLVNDNAKFLPLIEQKASQKDPIKDKRIGPEEDKGKKKINESKKSITDSEKSEVNVSNFNEANEVSQIVCPAFSSTNILNDSREGSIDKLEEKDLKGFDEVNAKEMESKVDKFIEQMILKTSDDESKSKMRSKYKQTKGKEEVGKAKGNKTTSAKISKELGKSKITKEDEPSSSKESEKVIPKPDLKSGDHKESVDVVSSVSVSFENTDKGKKKNANKQKEKNALNHTDEPDKQVNETKKLVKPNVDGNEQNTSEGMKELSKNSDSNIEGKNDKRRDTKKSNISAEKKISTTNIPEDNTGKDDIKCIKISSSRRTSVSSRVSSDTTVSECKVILESVDNLPDYIKAKKVAPELPINQSENKDSNKKTVETKVKYRGKVQVKKAEESHNETSDSDDEPLSKRTAKLKVVKKKSSVTGSKGRPKRGSRELKSLDTSQVPLRTSRARIAKHSSSSFYYYETDSSSHYSSSEEEFPVKKIEAPPNVKEDMTTQTDNAKNSPKGSADNSQLASFVSPVCSKSLLLEEKKINEIPEDLIDFKSDFEGSDVLLMYPTLKDTRHMTRDEVLSPEDVRNIVKDIKASMPKLTEIPSTSSPVNLNCTLPEGIRIVTPDKLSCENKLMYEEGRGSMDLLASVAEDISAKMNAMPVATPKVTSPVLVTPSSDIPVVNPTTSTSSSSLNADTSSPVDESKAPPSVVESQEIPKPKPKPSSIGETWIQAFKRAKIPKPGHLSPISQSVKPFVRKHFMNQPFVSKPTSLKSESDAKFKPFDRSSFIKSHTSSSSSSSKQVGLPFKPSNNSCTIPLVKPLTPDTVKETKCTVTPKTSLNIPVPHASNLDIKREQKLENIVNQPILPKVQGSSIMRESSFRPMEVKSEDSKLKGLADPARRLDATKRIELTKNRETPGGKHHNLPLAVEHTLRKMSPVAVSRKPVASVTLKPQIQTKDLDSKDPNIFDQSKSNRSSPSSGSKSSWLWKHEKYLNDSLVTKVSDLELMAKKKVSMTPEEIEKWLDDSTSTGIEHSKDCGLFEKNECGCSFRTSGSSMQNSVAVIGEHSTKVGRSIVEPPMQLKDIEPKCTAETISTCKVEDYKEKLISKSPISLPKENKPEGKKDSSVKTKHSSPTKQEKPWKSTRSMTEEEMCEFDFRFERNSNSPRESCSEMSSPTPKDEMSSSNDEGIGSHQSERKSIFHKKNRPLSKSPCAFNAENESSVYAFEPEPDTPITRPLFRRKNNKFSAEESGRSNSIAVQVYLEPEAVLESSTQTDREEEEGGTTFYIPLRGKSVEPQQVIQGVTVKLDADPDGQEHRVTLRAKLVTKPSTDFPRPPPTSRSLVGRSTGKSGKPEQKVRPLSMSDSKPPVGTVQPTLRTPAEQIPSTSQESFATSTCSKSSQSTQFSTTPLKLSTDNKATSPLQSNSKSAPDLPFPSWPQGENGFPKVGMSPKLVEAPAFYPSEKEFSDPLEYLEKITPEAEHYGICRIVPPPSFKPECKVSDDMRFTSYNQYVHKMMRRWGPNVKEMTAIKKYLATQSIALTHPPWIGGMEVDLPRLYQTVQQCGGLKEVIEKKRWTRVADSMKIPKSAQDRVTKLDDIYCKYLLPYDTLSHNERCKLLEQVEHDWEEKERRILLGESTNSEESDSDSDDGMLECITKGRSMALSQFYRIARNTLWMWFGSEGDPPATEKIESEYWNQVTERMSHVCVNSGSIDCGTWGYGFPTAKTSSTAKHPWNLKVLTNHPQSVLRSLPPLMGVTVPTLHVGMLFSTFCWYRDPHGLPWIEYLHTGANKIWYGVPDEWTNELRGAIKSVLPSIVRESPVWLPSDTAMLPPQLLLDKGVSLCRTVQEPGQFIVIFPKAYTSAICTGYLVSESVYYAPSSWLATAELLFKETKESCEPTMFSLEKLLFSIASDSRSSLDILLQICPMVETVRNREVKERKELQKLGLLSSEKLPKPTKRNNSSQQQEYECNNCRSNLFLSLVNNSNEDANYCLADALDLFSKDSSQVKYCKLLYLYDEEEMEELVDKIKTKIDVKSQKKNSKSGSNIGLNKT